MVDFFPTQLPRLSYNLDVQTWNYVGTPLLKDRNLGCIEVARL